MRIVFHGEEGGHLRVRVECEARGKATAAEPLDRVGEVTSVVEALGGRVTGSHPADGTEVLLPRR